MFMGEGERGKVEKEMEGGRRSFENQGKEG